MYYFIITFFFLYSLCAIQKPGHWHTLPFVPNWIRCFIVTSFGINQTDYTGNSNCPLFFFPLSLKSLAQCQCPVLCHYRFREYFRVQLRVGRFLFDRCVENLTLHLCSIQIWEIGYNTKKCAENQTGARTLDEGSRGKVIMSVSVVVSPCRGTFGL